MKAEQFPEELKAELNSKANEIIKTMAEFFESQGLNPAEASASAKVSFFSSAMLNAAKFLDSLEPGLGESLHKVAVTYPIVCQTAFMKKQKEH